MVIYGYLWHQYDLELLGGTLSWSTPASETRISLKVVDVTSELCSVLALKIFCHSTLKVSRFFTRADHS